MNYVDATKAIKRRHSEQNPGGCRMLSKGEACACTLCLADGLRVRITVGDEQLEVAGDVVEAARFLHRVCHVGPKCPLCAALARHAELIKEGTVTMAYICTHCGRQDKTVEKREELRDACACSVCWADWVLRRERLVDDYLNERVPDATQREGG